VGPLKFHSLAITLACLALFVTCGIENYYYLEPVQYVSANINSATVLIPQNSALAEFRYYTIFYRIYLSDQNLAAITTDANRSLINSALASHYNTIDPYTSNDNVSPNAIASIFSSLKYHSMYYMDEGKINEYSAYQVLQQEVGIWGGSWPTGYDELLNADLLNFDFTDSVNGAYLTATYRTTSNGGYHTFTPPDHISDRLYLYRSRDRFTPQPNRYFIFSDGAGNLTDETIITENVNTDVEKNPNMTSSNRYVYVSLYIVAVGMDPNFTTIYSKPKHIGIFRLPGAS
jgi:hypothetical protein